MNKQEINEFNNEKEREINKIKMEINNSQNIFDIYIYIFALLKKYQANVINLMSQDINGYTSCLKKVEEIFDKYREKVCFDEFKSNLCNYLETYDENELLKLISIIQRIDSNNYKNPISRYNCIFEDMEENDGEKYSEIKMLNTNKTEIIGKVYYRQKTYIENLFNLNKFPRSEDRRGSSLEGLVSNLIIVPTNHLADDYKVEFLKVKSDYVLDKIKNCEGKLSFALVPFSGDKDYLIYHNEGNLFIIDGVKDEEIYITKLLNIMDHLKNRQVDIVIFPEMVFTSKMLSALKKYLRKEENKGYFTLIVSGSIWEKKSNWCEVLDGNGITISKQYKLNQFHLTNDYNKAGNNEGILIDSSRRIINIYDIDGLGRICTPICVDFITEDYFNNILKMGTNVCFAPTCTTSLQEFYDNSKKIGCHNYGSIFISNTCITLNGVNRKKNSDLKTMDKVLFSYIPIKLPIKKALIKTNFFAVNGMKRNKKLTNLKNIASAKLRSTLKDNYSDIDFSMKCCKKDEIEKCINGTKGVCFLYIKFLKNSCNIEEVRI